MRVFMAFFILIFLSGCFTKEESSPKEVTAEFWKYYMDNDLEKAKKLTVYKKINKAALPEEIEIKSFKIGEVYQKDGNAEVKTTLKLARKDDGNDTIEITFNSILLLIGDNWKIDFSKTSQNLLSEVAKLEAHEISNTIMTLFLNGVENVKEFQKIFEKSFKEINKKMQKAFEQMQKELREMEKDINSSSI